MRGFGAPLSFSVRIYSNFAYKEYIVKVNGKEVEADENGFYTIPAGNENAIVTIEGAAIDQSSGKKLSFWELLLQFFRKIIAFFTGKK